MVWRGAGWLVVLLVLVGRATAQPAASPRPWSPELNAAFELYDTGDLHAAQQHCRSLLHSSREADVRRDAGALLAMALLRGESRSDRADGRARLAQLAREDPVYRERPECLLAVGLGLTGLSETAAALDALDEAATRFAAAGRDGPLGETLVALIDAWLRHAEWEFTAPRFGVGRPETPEAAVQVRLGQAAAVRARAAELPAPRDVLARIDALVAEHRRAVLADPAGAVEVLTPYASGAVASPAIGEAVFLLAECRVELGQAATAQPLYELVQAASLGELSERARRRAAELCAGLFTLAVPAHVAPGTPVSIQVTARNVARLQVEVRRVDLPGWLTAQRGRLNPAQLPVSGAVQFERELALPADGTEWHSDRSEAPLTIELPVGAFVVWVRVSGAGGAILERRELVICSDLHATLILSADQALLWASSSTTSASPDARAQFWMHGSFVATQPRLEQGLARFALPAEARVLRDKRWTCLVQDGEHLALRQGRFDPSAAGADSTATGVALAGGPRDPRVGETYTLLGVLTGAPSAWPKQVQIAWVDALERPAIQRTVPVTASGTVTAGFAVTDELVGKHLNVLVSDGQRTIESIRGRLPLHVRPAHADEFSLTARVPARVAPEDGVLRLIVAAQYPWGTPLAGGRAWLVLRAAELSGASAVTPDTLVRRGSLDERGRLQSTLLLRELSVPHGPAVVGVWVSAARWDGRVVNTYTETVVAAEPLPARITADPPAPAVGQPTVFQIDWFDARGGAGLSAARLRIQRGAETIATLALHLAERGLRSEAWTPQLPGAFEAVLEPGEGAAPVTQGVTVSPDAVGPATVRLAAHLDSAVGRVRVELRGVPPRALLVLDDAKLHATAVPAPTDVAVVEIPYERASPPRHVQLLVADKSGISCAGRAAIARAQPIELSIPPTPLCAPAGQICEVRVAVASGDRCEGVVLARLTPGLVRGAVRWLPGEERDFDAPTPGPPGSADGAPDHADLEPLVAGQTLWVGQAELADGAATLRVPLPNQRASYRLVLAARTPDGRISTQCLRIDGTQDVAAQLDLSPALTVGDRVPAAVVLQNQTDSPRTVRIAASADGFALETMRPAGAARTDLLADGTLTLELPGGAREIVTIEAEAARVGQCELHVLVEGGDQAQRLTGECTVLTDTPEDSAAGLRIERTLFLVEPVGSFRAIEVSAENLLPAAGDVADWPRTPIAPGEQIAPGSFILVREEFTLAEPWSGIDWSQPVPAVTHDLFDPPDGMRTIGRRVESAEGRLRFEQERAASGSHVHEYLLVAVRPGSCRVPPPQVTRRGTSVPVLVEPANVPLLVGP